MSLDKATIARLLIREHDKLAGYVWSIVRDDHLVDDILQELALTAIRKCDEIVDESHFLGWMRVAARRTSLDVLKKRSRHPQLLSESVLDLLDAEWAEHDAMPAADVSEALRACLEKLSPYARRLVDLRYGEGLKSSRVAALLQRNIASVYVALTRIHRALGECIRRRISKEASHG